MRLIEELIMFTCIFGVVAGVPSVITIALLRLIAPERWPKAWMLCCLATAVWCGMALVSAYGHYQRTLIAWAENDYYVLWVSYLPWLALFAPAFPVFITLLWRRPKH